MNGSLRQRSPGSWELTVDLGRDARGKRRRKYLTVRGTKAQARRRLREPRSVLDMGIDLPTENILLRDWLDRYMADFVTPQRRQGTKELYQRMIGRHIVPAIGHVELAKLRPIDVQVFEAELAKTLAPGTVRLAHAVLSGALKYAMQMEMVQRNVASLVSPPSIVKREAPTPDVGAVRRALELARAEEHPLYACIHLVAYTGVRRGEAMDLLWNNVDLRMRRILIEGSLGWSAERGLILEPPKTASGLRTVDIDGGTALVLAMHLEDQGRIKRKMRHAYRDEGRVFAGPTGEWLKPVQLTRAVKRLGERVGYPDMTVRSLRHFHASVAIQAGQNIVVVSKRLGHSNVSITSDIYAHSLQGWQRQAAEAFAAEMEQGDEQSKEMAG